MSESPSAYDRGRPTAAHEGPLLSAVELSKTYNLGRVDVPVLTGASLEVARGEWVAVLGASGSGKSTLLHLMGDLDTPDGDDGDLRFDGGPIASMTRGRRNQYRNQSVGFVFQFYHLLPELDVLANTMLPSLVRESLRPCWYWLVVVLSGALISNVLAAVIVGLWMSGSIPVADDMFAQVWGRTVFVVGCTVLGAVLAAPIWIELRSLMLRFGPQNARLRARARELLDSFGLGHRLRHRPRELSGGERQRVAIARALMNEPDVLLADEPTGNLDEQTGAAILDLLAEQHRNGLTIVMVTHDPAVAERADRVVELHNGRVVS
jgi:ABC-type lipoprotein export system ATPase subunit